MTKSEFEALAGTDTIVDYDFNGEIQTWNLRHFVRDAVTGKIRHDRLPMIPDAMYPRFSNPRPAGGQKASHGGY